MQIPFLRYMSNEGRFAYTFVNKCIYMYIQGYSDILLFVFVTVLRNFPMKVGKKHKGKILELSVFSVCALFWLQFSNPSIISAEENNS